MWCEITWAAKRLKSQPTFTWYRTKQFRPMENFLRSSVLLTWRIEQANYTKIYQRRSKFPSQSRGPAEFAYGIRVPEWPHDN